MTKIETIKTYQGSQIGVSQSLVTLENFIGDVENAELADDSSFYTNDAVTAINALIWHIEQAEAVLSTPAAKGEEGEGLTEDERLAVEWLGDQARITNEAQRKAGDEIDNPMQVIINLIARLSAANPGDEAVRAAKAGVEWSCICSARYYEPVRPSVLDADTSGAHEPSPECPNCGKEMVPIRILSTSPQAAPGVSASTPQPANLNAMRDERSGTLALQYSPIPWAMQAYLSPPGKALIKDCAGNTVTSGPTMTTADAALAVLAVNSYHQMLAALKRAQGLLLIDGDPFGIVAVADTEDHDVIDVYQQVSEAIKNASIKSLGTASVAHGNQGEHVEAVKPSPSPEKTEG